MQLYASVEMRFGWWESIRMFLQEVKYNFVWWKTQTKPLLNIIYVP